MLLLAALKSALARKSCGRCALFLSLRFRGLFSYCLTLSVFGKNKTNSNADSPGKLLYHFAVTREVRPAAPVAALAVMVCAVILTSGIAGKSVGVSGCPVAQPWVYGGELQPHGLPAKPVASSFYVSVREWVFGFK